MNDKDSMGVELRFHDPLAAPAGTGSAPSSSLSESGHHRTRADRRPRPAAQGVPALRSQALAEVVQDLQRLMNAREGATLGDGRRTRLSTGAPVIRAGRDGHQCRSSRPDTDLGKHCMPRHGRDFLQLLSTPVL